MIEQHAGGAAAAIRESDRTRWNEIQRLFELCRERGRDDWHAVLRAQCAGQEGLAFEVLSLLVAAEGLPPLESGQAAIAAPPERA